ncbi:MAG: tRNA pseudouridine(54/55) synthase Pus10 [Candidatus Bipolaricaulota bacterium]
MSFDPKDARAARARELLAKGSICDDCLGGAFGKIGRGVSNAERGRELRRAWARGPAPQGKCWVCEDAFSEVGAWALRALAAAEGVEFSTYLFGVKLPLRWQEVEAHLVEVLELEQAEPAKHAWNRAVGKAFEALLGRGTVDFQDPDVLFTIDLETQDLTRHTASLFVYGRYRKLARDLPQTHWPCRACRGRGCAACGGTGKQYQDSVEEVVAAPFVAAAKGSGASLHGAGREDIDARMLGNGRPFVLEVLEPRRRSLDLVALRAEVNREARGRVEVGELRWAARGLVAALKETPAEKTYRAVVSLDRAVTLAEVERAVANLVGTIEQRTPRRVAHRRADLVRPRRVLTASVIARGERVVELTVRADGGLYIKELVSGDAGRTRPSLAANLGVEAAVTELDVLRIDSPRFPDSEPEPMDTRSNLA